MPDNLTILTVTRYPSWAVPFAVMSMAVFRLPLLLGNNRFWKLMGSGKNGTFDKTPDWRQWAVLCVSRQDARTQTGEALPGDPSSVPAKFLGTFIPSYWRFFKCTSTSFLLEPIEGHGTWDGKEAFGKLPANSDYAGEIAVLTRATIRLSKLKSFWNNVDAVAVKMSDADGFVQSYGIGEVPLIRQATFSIWRSKAAMKNFAYKMREHAEVIRKTRKEQWYSEEMFMRFRILQKIEH